ncbi:MAG: magnesium chelatase ATPase subunit D [Chloroflexales bacterium]|nr:magnesium chelatase ATPase subunit D [Chloroflexales bacterium]
MKTPTLPFPALVGLDTARQALLLLAVDPQLGGVILAAGVGTGKSTLMRSFARLLEIQDWQLEGAGQHPHLAQLESPFVEMPVGVTEDRILGGLDLEATLATGRRTHRSGLLARAHGGLLYADGVNLLEDSTINHLLGALDTGIVRVERDGLSVAEPARFALLATYDPAEGPPRRHLLDRIGLIVAPIAQAPAPARAEVVRRNLAHGLHTPSQRRDANTQSTPPSLLDEWEEEEDLLRAMILAARETLPTVIISDEQIEQIVGSALALGVEGQRADIFATRAALASAALAGRDEVTDEDLERAIRFVLLPRATRIPQFEADEPPPPEPPEPPEPPPTEQDNQQDDEEETPPDPSEDSLTIEDLVLAAMETDVPPDVLETPFTIRRHGRSGSRGSTSGKRGRHIRSVPGLPGDGRLDVIATLRAAAPWQQLRAKDEPPPTTNAPQRPKANHTNGAHPSSNAQDAPRIRLRADDLHIKRFRSKAGTLFCFLVDASGSMALHRMRQAKGAVNALLQQAYVHRDQVALLAFRGESAELLLPPSQSVELAKRALDVLPTGGGTPLAAALLSAYQLAEQARSRGIHRTTLVLITDGRPNVPLQPDPTLGKQQRLDLAREEVQRLAGKLRIAGIGAVVIDTQRSFVSRGEAQQLATWLGGRYVYLPQGRSDQIAQAVLDASAEE